MPVRSKRAAFQFIGMIGLAAQQRVFEAAQSVLKAASFIGIVQNTKGCMLILQNHGRDVRLSPTKLALASAMHIRQQCIKIIDPPVHIDGLKGVNWTLTSGILRLGGKKRDSDPQQQQPHVEQQQEHVQQQQHVEQQENIQEQEHVERLDLYDYDKGCFDFNLERLDPDWISFENGD